MVLSERKACSTRDRLLVGLDDLTGAHRCRIEAGADDVEAIQAGLGRDFLPVARPSERLVADGDLEVFLDLAAVGLATDPSVDPIPAAVAQALGDGLEDLLGGLQQRFPLARPLLPQARVETHQQALARKLRADDLGHLVRDQCLRTQRGRLAPVCPLLPQQLADVGGFQGRDPVQSRRLQFLADPGRGDHAPVPHQGHPAHPEPIPDLGNLRPQRHRIPPVARKHRHRHRTALFGAQQSEHDLLLALLAVPVVTERRQWTTPSLQEAGGDVIEDQGGLADLSSVVYSCLFDVPSGDGSVFS